MQTPTSPADDKIDFLEQKNEALVLENAYLREQNVQLTGKLEMANKVIESLKDRMTSTVIEHDQKARRKSSLGIKLPLDANEPVISKYDSAFEEKKEDLVSSRNSSLSKRDEELSVDASSHRLPEGKVSFTSLGEPIPPIALKKENSDIRQLSMTEYGVSDTPSGMSATSNPKKQHEIKEKFAKTMELNSIMDLGKLISGILDNPEVFYNFNNVMRLVPPSPFARMKALHIEKRLEEIESLLKKWTNMLKDVNQACMGYMKSMDAFANQLLTDKGFFENNKELQHIVVLIAQFLKENAVYLEVFTKVVNNSICNPFKSFYKDILPTYKETKKKVQKNWEEMEAAEAKYLALKRSAFLKDPFGGQSLLKAYVSAFRSYEIGRLDHMRNLNDINVNFNIEFIDKLCAIFTSKVAYLNSSFDLVAGLEDQIRLYTSGVTRKSEIYSELNEEFRNLRAEIESAIYIKYPASLLPNVVKEGYLFVKHETKDFKKRYCVLQEDGMLCWIKDTESSSEEPQLKEIVDIKLCKVKETNEHDLMFCFELFSAVMKKPILLQADSEASVSEWVSTIQNHIETLLFRSSGNMRTNLAPLKRADSTNDHANQEKLDKHKTHSHPSQSPNTTKTKQALISHLIETNNCADCGASSPSWLSLNLGTLICIECSGVHRRLGPNVSKVRSLKLDNLSLNLLELFSKLPTKEVNRVWEGVIEETPTMKPGIDADQDRREAWIRNKYLERVFVRPLETNDHIKAICDALKANDILKVLNVLAITKKDLNDLYMIENRRQGILHYACAYSGKENVELLVRNGCAIDLEDEEHCKPLERAMIAHNVEVMEYLIAKLDEMER